jgi:glutamate synthase (NADPH/NADH) small chain
MEKHHIDRRVAQMEGEGVVFRYGVEVGVNARVADILDGFDAVLLATGAERPRDPGIAGMDLTGVHYAMPYLVQSNRRVNGEPVPEQGSAADIWAGRRHVVVVGGGDTASDCIGTAFRQGAISVTQLDIRPLPPAREDKMRVWPYWPTKLRTSSSQAEGAEREFQVATLEFVGDNGRLTGIKCAKVDDKRSPVEGSEFVLPADLAFIAIGFAGPRLDTYLAEFGEALARDRRTNVRANETDYRTSMEKVFAAGDVRRGQSLVVWAIREGRQAARAIDMHLTGATTLPL